MEELIATKQEVDCRCTLPLVAFILPFRGFLPWRKQKVSSKKTNIEDCPLELVPETWLWEQRSSVSKVYVKDGWSSPKCYIVLAERGEYKFKSVA